MTTAPLTANLQQHTPMMQRCFDVDLNTILWIQFIYLRFDLRFLRPS